MDGTGWIVETAKQVPALCVLAWCVKVFLSHLSELYRAQKEINVECRKAIDKNSEVLGRVAEVIRRCATGREG